MREMEDLVKNDKNTSDLIRIIKLLWRGKLTIISYTFVFALASVIFSLNLTVTYKSESILTIEENDPSLLPQIGGLGSLAQFGLISPQNDKSFEAIEMIKSRDFLKHLLNFEGVMPGIMAVKKYDKESGTLVYNENIYDSATNIWREGEQPSYLEVYEEYKEIVSATINSSGFISIKVEHISPYFAEKTLSLIIDETNNLARQKEIKKANATLDYLKNEISSASLSPLNLSLSRLIEIQYNKLVAARLNEDYLLIPLEKPFIPERKSKPNRALICVLGTILGGMLSVFWVIFRDSIYREIKS